MRVGIEMYRNIVIKSTDVRCVSYINAFTSAIFKKGVLLVYYKGCLIILLLIGNVVIMQRVKKLLGLLCGLMFGFSCAYGGDSSVQLLTMGISEKWGYLDAGVHYVAPGGMVVTRHGGSTLPPRAVHYPAGYYREGKPSSEMMSNWLPYDDTHIYIRTADNAYHLFKVVDAAGMRSYEAFKVWARRAGIVYGISSVCFLKLLYDDVYYGTYKNSSLPFLGFLSMFISGICGLGCWSTYATWMKSKHLAQADRARLMEAMEGHRYIADDCAIVFDRTLSPGSVEGLIEISNLASVPAHRRLKVYQFDTIACEERTEGVK
jgi:hypothetical protein